MDENGGMFENRKEIRAPHGGNALSSDPLAEMKVSEEQVQRDYKNLIAELDQESFSPEAEPLDFAANLGSTLYVEALRARFEGVKENLGREILSGMCTVEQAYTYLENMEISLLLEQELALTVTS